MNAAVVVAGGEGVRFGAEGGKQLAPVAGRPLVVWALAAFDACRAIDAIVLVCHPDRVETYRSLVAEHGLRKVTACVPGGATRRASVLAGLRALPEEAAIVAVHDGARPLVTPALIEAAIGTLEARPTLDGVVVGHPSYDTIKVVDEASRILSTPDRASLWVAQTPQVFRAEAIRSAHAEAERDGFEGTDDSSLVERRGGTVAMIPGPRDNIKVTVPEDLAFVASVLDARAGEAS